MDSLIGCRFMQTALSAEQEVDRTKLMADFDDFYIAATNLLCGDWRVAGRECSKCLYLLNDKGWVLG